MTEPVEHEESDLRALFAETLEIPVEEVHDGLAYGTIPSWDSISHMALIAALDTRYHLMIETDDVIAMSSFAKCKEILRKYGVVVA